MTRLPSDGRLGLLAHHDFRSLWLATTISYFGTQISALALPLLAISVLGAGPFEMGLLNAATWLPFLLIGLPAGVWVDRLRRRPILVVADAGRGVLLLTITAASFFGVLSLAQAYAVAFLVGVLAVFFETAYTSYLPSLVPPDRIMEGNTKLEVSRGVASVAGPPVAGVLIGLVGAATAIALDGLSFFVSALFLNRIRSSEPHVDRSEDVSGMRAEMASGLRFVLGHPILRASLVANTIANVALSVFQTLFILYLVRDLALSAAVVGALLAIENVAGLAGAVLVGRLGRQFGIGPTLAVAIGAEGVTYALVALAPPNAALPYLAAAAVILGFFSIVFFVTALTLRQTIAPARLQGRMNATYRFATWGVLPLGSAAAGLLGSVIGIRSAIAVAAVIAFAAVVPVVLSGLGRLRTAVPATS